MLYYALTRNLLSILLAKVKLKIQLSSKQHFVKTVLFNHNRKKKLFFPLFRQVYIYKIN